MLKKRNRKSNNSGNTFIVVMVTIAVMGILVAVILATMGYFYRTRMMELNSKNNFYYVEKAMDDIYTGIGSRSTDALMRAYEETVSQMVVYDLAEQKYKTIDEAKANDLMKQKFLGYLQQYDPADPSTQFLPKEAGALRTTLQSFITVDGVDVATTTPDLYMEVQQTTVDGKTRYDKIIIHNITVTHTTDDGYIQSITTDIEISEPQFQVSFNNASRSSSSLYNYAVVSDMGLEFVNEKVGKQYVNISGNVYASSDYYNKDYNGDDKTRVNSYSDAKLQDCRGITETSKYSGIYAKSVNLNIVADTVIVPGSISVINDGDVKISGDLSKKSLYTDVWADNIIIAPGYTRLPFDGSDTPAAGTMGHKMGEGKLTLFANAYIADDLEINGEDAAVELHGNYYGYNYSQTPDSLRVLAEYATGKSHTNSSAIIVNGNNANVDFSGLSELYVAGRSYISTSTVRTVNVSSTDNSVTTTFDSDTNKDNEDIRTGESIAVRSNQIAYIVGGTMKNSSGDTIPMFTSVYPTFNDVIYQNIKHWLDDTDPVKEEVISGKSYTFLNFKGSEESAAFFDWYANTLPTVTGYSLATDLVDVKSYDNFQVDSIATTRIEEGSTVGPTINTSGSYTTGALQVADGNSLTVNKGTLLDAGYGLDSTTLNTRATNNNEDYLEYKYALKNLADEYSYIDAVEERKDIVADPDDPAQAKINLTAQDAAKITPINYYLNMQKVDKGTWTDWKDGNQVGTSYVWISKDDIVVKAPAGSDHKVTGIIVTEGDVIFDSSQVTDDQRVDRFEGIIISGGKIKANYGISFVANPELMRTILRTAGSTKGQDKDLSAICDIFKDYAPEDSSSSSTNIGNIEVGDILQYANWKKNVK